MHDMRAGCCCLSGMFFYSSLCWHRGRVHKLWLYCVLLQPEVLQEGITCVRMSLVAESVLASAASSWEHCFCRSTNLHPTCVSGDLRQTSRTGRAALEARAGASQQCCSRG